MDSWKLLKSECADCSRCELCETRTNLVFGVGNEAAAEAAFTAAPETLPPPAQWTSGEQPPYAYYLYYLNANIQSLNHFRLLTGRNVFDFRPHCGETVCFDETCDPRDLVCPACQEHFDCLDSPEGVED